MVRDKVVYAFLREDDTPFYIGMGSVDRARNHKKGSRNYRWWEEMKSNPNYKFIIVDRSLTKQQAWDIEVDLIKEFGRQHFDNGGILTNIHPGGSFYGDHVLKSVIQFDLEGNKLNKFNSMIEAGRHVYDVHGGNMYSSGDRGHAYQGGISSCCRYTKKSIKGYQWFYESEVGDIDYIGPVKQNSTWNGGHDSSRKTYINRNTMKVFGSGNKAAKSIGLSPNSNVSAGTLVSRVFLDVFTQITKEEYYYLQELIKL